MHCRVTYVTRTVQTIEAETFDNAEARVAASVREMNDHAHHGERTHATIEFHMEIDGRWQWVTVS